MDEVKLYVDCLLWVLREPLSQQLRDALMSLPLPCLRELYCAVRMRIAREECGGPIVQTRNRRFLATAAGPGSPAAVHLGRCPVPERLV